MGETTMSATEFLTRMQDYYGLQYNKTMAEEILVRIQCMSEEAIERLCADVLTKHSAKYRTLPDVAILFEADTKDLLVEALMVFDAKNDMLRYAEKKQLGNDGGE